MDGHTARGRQRSGRLRRRHFLLGGAAVAGGALAAATTRAARAAGGLTGAVGSGSLAAAQPTMLSLAEFLRLSAVLTGVADTVYTLSSDQGRLYLDRLQATPEAVAALDLLYTQAGFRGSNPPRRFEDLASSGIYDQAATSALADRIARWWYTGVYDGATGPAVATFDQTVAWQVAAYGGTPPSQCHGLTGFWASSPTGQ